jgi:MFS family permease
VYISHRWALYIPLFLLGIFGAGHSGLADTFMIESIPSHRREETIGLVYTFRMGISAAAPLLVGILSEWTTIEHTFLILAFLPGFAALLISSAEEKQMD